MNRLYEEIKVDCALEPQSLISTNATGKYFNMAGFRAAMFVLNVGNITAGGSSAIQVMEALNERAGSAQNLTSFVATVAANVRVQKLKITCVGGEAEDILVITVDGTAYTFTGKAAEDLNNQEWIAGGDDSADATSIVACINYTLAGKIWAENTAGVITLWAEDGYYIEAVSETGAFTTFATLAAVAYVFLEGLDLSAGFTFVAAKVTTAANTGICGATLYRGKSVKAILQRVGMSYPA
ncbi:hypothetical protein ES708_33437 [subsurface metagenome]